MEDKTNFVVQPPLSYATGLENGKSARFFIQSRMLKNAIHELEENIFNFYETGEFELDLIITRVTDRFGERNKITPYIGPYFSHTFYGKTPVLLNIEGYAYQTKDNDVKHRLMTAYNSVFKASRVAETGMAPTLFYNDTFITGAFANIVISETSQDENILQFVIDFIVLEASYFSMESKGAVVDFTISYGALTKFNTSTYNPN